MTNSDKAAGKKLLTSETIVSAIISSVTAVIIAIIVARSQAASQVTQQLAQRTLQVQQLEADLGKAKSELAVMAGKLPSGDSRKVCVVYNDNWLDSLSVPEFWTQTTCANALKSTGWTGATHYQLVCADKDGLHWGSPDAGPPDLNTCGW